jgi:hypothetical protein
LQDSSILAIEILQKNVARIDVKETSVSAAMSMMINDQSPRIAPITLDGSVLM